VGLIGSPGSGKSTQAQALAERISKYSVVHHINIGQILRQSEDEQILKIMNEGELIPDEAVFRVLATKLKEVGDGFIILDGFFRRENEAEWLIKNQKDLDVDVLAVVEIKLSDEVAVERLQKRGRADDEAEDIKVRLRVFKENEKTILKRLAEYKICVLEVDGSPSVEEISKKIYAELAEWVDVPGANKELGEWRF
jgi:adenylate kinase